MRSAAAGLALGLACAIASPAAASGGTDAAATELFNAGRDLMKRGEYAAACPKLAESARLEPTVGALAKLAECEEHEQRLASAYGRWQQALNLARSMGDARAMDVERELVRLGAIVPKLSVQAAGALPADAVIQVDDVELGPGSLGVPLAVEPGKHVVRAHAPHKRTWSTTAETSADGATISVVVPVLEDAQPAPEPPPQPLLPFRPVPPPAPVDVGSPSNRTLGLAVAGVGLGALVVGGVLGGVAMHQRDEAGCAAGNVCPDQDSADTLHRAQSSANVSTALFIAGAVLVAGGASLWWLSRAHDSAGVHVAWTPAGVAGSF